MTKFIHRSIADAAQAIALATLPVLMTFGLVPVPVPVRVRVTEQSRR